MQNIWCRNMGINDVVSSLPKVRLVVKNAHPVCTRFVVDVAFERAASYVHSRLQHKGGPTVSYMNIFLRETDKEGNEASLDVLVIKSSDFLMSLQASGMSS